MHPVYPTNNPTSITLYSTPPITTSLTNTLHYTDGGEEQMISLSKSIWCMTIQLGNRNSKLLRTLVVRWRVVIIIGGKTLSILLCSMDMLVKYSIKQYLFSFNYYKSVTHKLSQRISKQLTSNVNLSKYDKGYLILDRNVSHQISQTHLQID